MFIKSAAQTFKLSVLAQYEIRTVKMKLQFTNSLLGTVTDPGYCEEVGVGVGICQGCLVVGPNSTATGANK